MADNTPIDSTSRLGLVKSRLSVAKSWCKKPHDAMKQWIKEYEISDISDTEEVRDKVRIPKIFRQVESDLPAIFDDQPELFIKGKGKNRVLDPLFDSMYDYLWSKQNLEEVVEDAATYFCLIGMGFVDSPWVTKNKQVVQSQDVQQPVIDPSTKQPVLDPLTQQPQMETVSQDVTYDVPYVDNPQAETKDPFKVFFSPETKFAIELDYAHCPYYVEEFTMTPEEVKARFDKEVDATEVMDTDMADTNAEIDKLGEYKDDMKRVTVYRYYGCLPEAHAKNIKDSPNWTYDKDYLIWFTNSTELLAEECPYDVKPLHILGNYGLANKFWKYGDAKYLRVLVSELEQYRAQILKHTRKMANPKPMMPSDADVDEAAFQDPNVGRIVKYTPSATGDKPYYLAPPNLGQEVAVGINMVRTDIEQASGSFELAQGGSQSQVRTPRGIQTFSEAADKNIRRKRKKVARFIRQLLIFQFKQCSMNWVAEDGRTLDIVTGNESEEVPVVKEVLQILGDPDILSKIEIEVESLSVNRVQMKQDALDLFDIIVQHPDVFNVLEAAKDLLQNGFNKKDADRYLLTPEQRDKLMQQQAQAQGGQGQQGPSESIGFKDLPPEGKIQMAQQAGIQLSPQGIAQQDALAANQKTHPSVNGASVSGPPTVNGPMAQG